MQKQIVATIAAREGECVGIDDLGRTLSPQSVDPGNVVRIQVYRIKCAFLRRRSALPFSNVYGKGYAWTSD